MRILGIDPSSQSTGFGVIDYADGNYKVSGYGLIKPSRQLRFPEKLKEIHDKVQNLLETYAPDEVAIENPFYAQNIKTAITLGQVRGAILVAVASLGRQLFEYSPLEIKKAITGYGQAEKAQVRQMIKTLLNIQEESLNLDASDALACAYCHLNSRIFQMKVEASQGKEGS